MPKILMRRDTLANWRSTNPTLLAGEWGFETDTKRIKIGNGVDAYNDLDYWRESDNVWEPEAEWIDMRSACLPNSIYFLVAHGNATESSGTYSISLYPTFGVSAVLSGGDGSTYDVFVDGLKVGTYASGDDAILDWEALYNADKVEDAFAITYPATLMSHVVRVTPTNSAHTFTQIGAGKGITEDDSGLIWVHVSTNARISYGSFLDTADNGNPLLEAVTANDNVLYCSNLDSAFRGNAGLKSVPIIDGEDESELDIDEAFKGCTAMKRVTFQNVDSNSTGTFDDCTNLKVINGDGCTFNPDFNNVPALKALPGTMKVGQDRTEISLSNVAGLKDTALDFSSESQLDKLTITGNDNQNAGLIGLTVSSDAEFGSLIEPQIDIHNTNMSRYALVGLFESMPYNVGYTVVGSPTINSGLMSGASNNDYITIPAIPFVGNDIEYVLKYSFSGSIDNYRNVWFGGLGLTTFQLFTGGQGDYITLDMQGDSFTFRPDTPIYNYSYFKFSKQGTNLTMSFGNNGSTWLESKTFDAVNWKNYPSVLSQLGRCQASKTSYLSIDLNHTYIKLNGIPWFGPGATRNMKPAGEIVGSPTIVDGVASGFSNESDSYAGLDVSNFDSSKSYQWHVKFQYKPQTNVLIFGAKNQNNKRPSLIIDAAALRTTLASGVGLSAEVTWEENAWYEADFTFDGVDSYTLSLYKDGGLVSTSSNTYSSALSFTTIYIGSVCNSSLGTTYTGSIDLNQTYIKVNDVMWYRGMVPATKRISIAGCSGTSSLSPEDKAIVTDKNWALTLS